MTTFYFIIVAIAVYLLRIIICFFAREVIGEGNGK